MIIRKAKKEDIDSIVKLLSVLEKDHLDLDLSAVERDFVGKKENVEQEIKSGLEKSLNKETDFLLVAENDGSIVGYLKAEVEKRSPTKLYNKKLYIRHLVVLKEYRNKRIGTQLIKEVEKIAESKGIPFITLKTSPKNKEALDFYKRLGFEDIYIELVKGVKY